MDQFNVTETSPFLIEKMSNVVRILREEKTGYEMAAEHVPDESLKSMILTLAQESNQYAHEWESRINMLSGGAGVEIPEPELQLAPEVGEIETDVVAFCESNENKVTCAFREILDYPGIYEDLKQMVKYQLQGLQSAFLQFRLLNNLTPFSL
jgi:rubrerythrin